MSDFSTSLPSTTGHRPDEMTPGQMIRQARESMGLHIVALAAALKVPVRKLEALEANRWEELTDITFTRALASSVARHLKMDTAAVLAALPTAALIQLNSPPGLGRVGNGNEGVALGLTPTLSWVRHTWVVLVLLLGAATLYFSPQLKTLWPTTEQPTVITVPAVAPTSGASVSTETVNYPVAPHSGATVDPGISVPGVSPAAVPMNAVPINPVLSVADVPLPPGRTASDRVLVLVAAVDTWVEVTDANRRVRIQRVLKQGEEAAFSEGAPFGVVVGNAAGARVTVRGQSLDLTLLAKNNVARFDVK